MDEIVRGIAWLLAEYPSIVPIPGTSNPNHIDENINALRITLSSADMEESENGFAEIKVESTRTTEALFANHDIGVNLGESSKGTQGKTPWPSSKN
ncbi:MAG: aldo/keto reductase [Chitinophagaceae bacterium]|nr:aldo/keto reductase [Chitinophagaceae bacterium]